MKACSTPMDARSTSDAARMGEGSDAASALLDRSLFQPYLEPGEKILWVGRPSSAKNPSRWIPRPKVRVHPIQWIGGALLLISVGGVFAEKIHDRRPEWPLLQLIVSSAAALVFLLTFLAVISVLCYLLCFIAIFLCSYFSSKLSDISYALTDQRALAIDRASGRVAKMATYDPISRPEARLREDGSGNVEFGYKGAVYARWGRRKEVNLSSLTFENIDDAAGVLQLTQQVLNDRVVVNTQRKPLTS
jgi:hypothetical protein